MPSRWSLVAINAIVLTRLLGRDLQQIELNDVSFEKLKKDLHRRA